jgi:hypothetical protein
MEKEAGQSHERPIHPLQGEGWGANGGLIDETTARKPHPPPDLPLKGEELMRTAFMRLPWKKRLDIDYIAN